MSLQRNVKSRHLYTSKLVLVCLFGLLALSGCGIGSPQVKECDTPSVDQLTHIGDSKWKSYLPDCPTDKTSAEAALPRITVSSDLEACQLLEVNSDRERYEDTITGFPRSTNPSRLPDGKYNVKVIPVDWPDLKDDVDPMSFLPAAGKKYSDWIGTYTRGKVQLEVDVYPKWIELPVESKRFSQSDFEQNSAQWSPSNVEKVRFFWTEALNAADPFVDFTDIDIVMFILPRHQGVIAEFNLWPPGTGSFTTDEKIITHGFTPGGFHFRPENELWAFWAHETMHWFKMPDLYWTDLNDFRAQPETLPAPNYGFDIMNNANDSRRLNSWLQWLAGWMPDDQLACLTRDSFVDGSIEIASNEIDDSRTKAVMLKLSAHELLLIESHRVTEFDAPASRSRDGVLIQYVDTRIPHGKGTMTLIGPKGRTLIQVTRKGGDTQQVLDAVFYEGNVIDIAGYHIAVNEALETSDIVSFSKIIDWKPNDPAEFVCVAKENRYVGGDSKPLSCPLKL